MTLPSGKRAPARLRPPVGRVRRARHRGQALVEFAIIVPILLFLSVIAIDFGRLFFSYVQISNAAREGASYGAANPTLTTSIEDYARQETNAQGQAGENALAITVTCADPGGSAIACVDAPGGSGTGNTLTVGVNEQFDFLTPLINGFFGDNLQLSASATTVVLGIAASGGNPGATCTTPPTTVSNPFVVSIVGMTVNVDASSSRPDTGVCAIAGYDWEWGISPEPFPPITGKSATWTYDTAGTYVITLVVSNQAGSLTASQTVTVPSGAPTPTPTPVATPTPSPTPSPTPVPTPACTMIADFAFTLENGRRVTFTGSYTGSPAPLTWSWNFGSGSTPSTSNVQNPPQVQYSNSSDKTVTLTIANGSCTDSVSKTVKPKN